MYKCSYFADKTLSLNQSMRFDVNVFIMYVESNYNFTALLYLNETSLGYTVFYIKNAENALKKEAIANRFIPVISKIKIT